MAYATRMVDEKGLDYLQCSECIGTVDTADEFSYHAIDAHEGAEHVIAKLSFGVFTARIVAWDYTRRTGKCWLNWNDGVANEWTESFDSWDEAFIHLVRLQACANTVLEDATFNNAKGEVLAYDAAGFYSDVRQMFGDET